MKPFRSSFLIINIEVLTYLTDKIEGSSNQSVLKLHIVVKVRWQYFFISVLPV